MPQRKPRSTWLSPGEPYPHGGQTRKGAALFPDGKIRTVYAGTPDTFFSIPAHTHVNGWYASGFLTYKDGVWEFWFNELQGRNKTIKARNVFPTMYPKEGD